MIVANGKEFHTLNEPIYVGGRQVKEVYAGEKKVYPEYIENEHKIYAWRINPVYIKKYGGFGTYISNRYNASHEFEIVDLELAVKNHFGYSYDYRFFAEFQAYKLEHWRSMISGEDDAIGSSFNIYHKNEGHSYSFVLNNPFYYCITTDFDEFINYNFYFVIISKITGLCCIAYDTTQGEQFLHYCGLGGTISKQTGYAYMPTDWISDNQDFEIDNNSYYGLNVYSPYGSLGRKTLIGTSHEAKKPSNIHSNKTAKYHYFFINDYYTNAKFSRLIDIPALSYPYNDFNKLDETIWLIVHGNDMRLVGEHLWTNDKNVGE